MSAPAPDQRSAPGATRVTRHVLRPIDEVYATLTDPWSFPQWLVGCREIRAVDAGWPRAGTRFHHCVGLVGPLTVNDDTESLEADRPGHVAYEVRFRPFGRGRVDFWLAGAGSATTIHMDEAPIGLLAPTAPLAAPLIAGRNRTSLNALVALLNDST